MSRVLPVRTELPRPVRVVEDQRITMSDGVELSARLWLPEDADENPVPLVLEHLPYRKRDGTIARDEVTHPYIAGHGYACLRVDMRGNGDSEGLMADEYTAQEWQDACEVIAWARARPWCTGAVGMTGISWGGFNALQVAALQPEGLAAVVVNCTTVDRFADDIHFKGGCLLGENIGWAAQMLSYSSRPPDPALRDDWRTLWLDRLENMPFLAREWIGRQALDDYWKHGSVCADYSMIEAAVLIFQGWHDGYRNAPAHLLANVPCTKAVWGPWIHKYPHMAGPEPRIGYLQECLRHWDRHLKDIETEEVPDVRAWLMDPVEPARWHDERTGRWITGEWPGSNRLELKLTNEGLSREPDALDRAVSSPADCGAMAGEYFPFAFGPEFPDEQSYDDERSTCFDTPPLGTPLDIVGAPTLRLRLSADRPLAQCVARLCHVAPNGTSAFVTMGALNLTHRMGADAPTPLVPGEAFEVEISLDHIAQRIPAGHRLRLAISSAYWPFLWPSPERTTLTLEEGALNIPTRPSAKGDECSFEPPEGSVPWAAETLRDPTCSREVRTLKDGEVITTFAVDNGTVRDLAHGLRSGSWTKEVWTTHPDDPLCASVEIEWEQTGGRDDWNWRTNVTMRMHGDADVFRIVARLEAWEGNALAFERDWNERISRLYV